MNSPILNIYRDNASHSVDSLPFAMEISSNSSLIISQTRQPQGRAGEAASFKQPQAGQEKEGNPGELIPATQPQPAQQGEQLDYRQLVLQARRQQVEVTQEGHAGREAYREGAEPLKVQQALGVYRDNAELADGGAELMPRIDGYV